MSSFMYYVMRDEVKISDDTDEVRDVQTFLAVRRAYTKDDIAFLRFALFEQIFGPLNSHTVEHAARGAADQWQGTLSDARPGGCACRSPASAPRSGRISPPVRSPRLRSAQRTKTSRA